MTLSQLKSVCAAYHKKTLADLTVLSTDLFMIAANNARRAAEMDHNFEYARLTATLSIDGATGGALSSAVIGSNGTDALNYADSGAPSTVLGQFNKIGVWGDYPLYLSTAGTFAFYSTNYSSYVLALSLANTAITNRYVPATGTTSPIATYVGAGSFNGSSLILTNGTSARFSSLREIEDVQRLTGDGYLEPISFNTSSRAIAQVRDEIAVSNDYYEDWRYPSDRQLLARGSAQNLIQRGSRLFVYPLPAATVDDLSVTIEGYGWLRDYVTADLSLSTPVDFFCEFGHEFLQWSIIIELNHLFKTFVARQEGNLSAPEKMKQDCWKRLLDWDSYLIDPNTNASR